MREEIRKTKEVKRLTQAAISDGIWLEFFDSPKEKHLKQRMANANLYIFQYLYNYRVNSNLTQQDVRQIVRDWDNGVYWKNAQQTKEEYMRNMFESIDILLRKKTKALAYFGTLKVFEKHRKASEKALAADQQQTLVASTNNGPPSENLRSSAKNKTKSKNTSKSTSNGASTSPMATRSKTRKRSEMTPETADDDDDNENDPDYAGADDGHQSKQAQRRARRRPRTRHKTKKITTNQIKRIVPGM